MSQSYFVAWWNVENLFDSVNSPRRTDKLKRTLGKSLDGWTTVLRDRKITQLVKVIASLNDGAGPDLLGVCEVENEFVVNRLRDRLAARLPDRSYQVVHADTADRRGIDVAFLYDDTKLEVPAGQVFQHTVMRRTATRDIVQVNFVTKPAGRVWAVFGNHWPSRSGGQADSDGYRQIAGETLAFFHQRVREVHGDDTAVLVMGDFNDEPFNTSLVRHALSTRQRQRVLRASSPRLWNLMWPITGEATGTFFFNNAANVLDQFLVNDNMIEPGSPIAADAASVTIEDGFPGISDPDATYPQPIRFGGLGKAVNRDGFSDHFPVSIRVEESD
jgi:endonuclease/exonuclease/phosphatase family metal-dependent hydrolase